MKQLEEDFGLDRVLEIETDDEDNEAERVCHYHTEDDDTESDISGPSNHIDSDPWPQSYRKSMDMLSVTPTVSFLKENSFLISSQTSISETFLTKPLLPTTTCLDKDKEEHVPTSTLPIKLSSASGLKLSLGEQECSYSQSLLNAVNALCGIGILSTPYALKEGGWSSIFILFIFGIITCYTGILLKRCLDSSSQLHTYPDIGQAAFGISGRICIAIILYLELYSSCVEFLIMMSDNLSAFFPNIEMNIAGIHLNSYQICAIISTLVILPTVWLRNLSLLSYISVGGVVTLILVVLCLLWVGVEGDIGFHPSGKALDLAKLPITIGIYSFCYGSHSVFPNIYTSMKEPCRFPSILVISFVISSLLYAGVAICGYLMFAEATVPQFTLNLPTKMVASKVARWTMVVAPVTKFSLTITPIALSIEELLPSNQRESYGVSILVRTILVISTLVVALAIPYFGSMMALIGSFLVMLISLILPCVCYMRIGNGSLTKSQIGVCNLIIIVGVLSAITGTYSALKSMRS